MPQRFDFQKNLFNAIYAEKYLDRSSDVWTEGSEMQMKCKTSRLNLKGNTGQYQGSHKVKMHNIFKL